MVCSSRAHHTCVAVLRVDITVRMPYNRACIRIFEHSPIPTNVCSSCLAHFTTEFGWRITAHSSIQAHLSPKRTAYSNEGALVASYKRNHLQKTPRAAAVTFFRVRSAVRSSNLSRATPLAAVVRLQPCELTRVVETCVKSQAPFMSETLEKTAISCRRL